MEVPERSPKRPYRNRPWSSQGCHDDLNAQQAEYSEWNPTNTVQKPMMAEVAPVVGLTLNKSKDAGVGETGPTKTVEKAFADSDSISSIALDEPSHMEESPEMKSPTRPEPIYSTQYSTRSSTAVMTAYNDQEVQCDLSEKSVKLSKPKTGSDEDLPTRGRLAILVICTCTAVFLQALVRISP